MIGINFLPWRKKVSAKAKKKYLFILGSTLLAGGIVVYTLNLLTDRPVNQEQEGNAFLEQTIKTVNDQTVQLNPIDIRYQTLQSQALFVKEVEAKNQKISRILAEITNLMPNGAYLTKLEFMDDQVRLYGKANSNLDVNQLFKNILGAKHISEPKLKEINSVEKGVSFQISSVLAKTR